MRAHLFAVLMTIAAMVVLAVIEKPEDLVNLLAGTFTDGNRFSTGNTLPLIGRPWGFNHWAPQTRDGNRNAGSWWFQGNDHKLTWLRCTHQPSPWIGDWGWFLFSAQISDAGNGDRNPVTFWEPRAATIKPHYFDATVAPLGIRMELTPTDHGAIFRATFPQSSDRGKKRICFAEANWNHVESDSASTITGHSDKVKQDRMIISNFHMYIRIESDTAVERRDGDGDMTCFRYKSDTTEAVVRIATSLISNEQAKTNMNRELPRTKNFDDIASESRSVWNTLLRRVDVINSGELADDTLKHLTIFYSCLVRALSFPRRLDEIDENNNVVHYSPYDPTGKVHPGILVTDNGFWDTFRTVYPMLSLLYPDHLGDIISGWLNAYKEGGWLPSWASPGYRNCMVGTYADVVVADALVKKVKGFNYNLAIEALRKDSFTDAPKFAGGAAGKEGLAEYVERGYFAIPDRGQGVSESVSRTLDFGFADFAVAKAFESVANNSVGKERHYLLNDAARLMRRSNKASTSLFSVFHELMVPKSVSGTVSNRFNPIEWGNGFTEGNSWHHSFPPYALDNLIQLYGSKEKLLKKLHQMFAIPSDFGVGSYGQEIHEMTEMRALAMGQYGHNNQPVHHILYLFAMLGDRRTTEEAVRKVMDRAYGLDFFAGDEDNGEQGAWFVLSALGLYAAVPSTPDYVLGSPIFKHVRVKRGYSTIPAGLSFGVSGTATDSSYLDIVALGTSKTDVHVAQILWNNNPVTTNTISDELLQSDGILRFVMEGEPSASITRENLGIGGSGGIGGDHSEIRKQTTKQDEIIAALRAELAHAHDVEDELRYGFVHRIEAGVEYEVAESEKFISTHTYLSVGILMLIMAICYGLRASKYKDSKFTN